MTEAQCLAFLVALRVPNAKLRNGWMTGSCPLAPFTHAKGTDTMPSFGLSVAPGTRSYYSCFACRSGSADELLQALELYTNYDKKYDWKVAHDLLSGEQVVLPLPEYGVIPSHSVFTPWPDYWIQSFVPVTAVADAYAYLTGRGVSLDVVTHYDLRYDSGRQMVTAPYRDVFGRLAGARGRSIDPTAEGHKKHYDYTFQGVNNAGWCWYNESVLERPGPIVVVEGQFDCWRTAQAFPKTVATLTSKPTWDKMKKLADCGLVIQIPDNPEIDDAGRHSIEKFAEYCGKLGLRHKVVYLGGGVKDPAECHADYLRDKIQELL